MFTPLSPSVHPKIAQRKRESIRFSQKPDSLASRVKRLLVAILLQTTFPEVENAFPYSLWVAPPPNLWCKLPDIVKLNTEIRRQWMRWPSRFAGRWESRWNIWGEEFGRNAVTEYLKPRGGVCVYAVLVSPGDDGRSLGSDWVPTGQMLMVDGYQFRLVWPQWTFGNREMAVSWNLECLRHFTGKCRVVRTPDWCWGFVDFKCRF